MNRVSATELRQRWWPRFDAATTRASNAAATARAREPAVPSARCCTFSDGHDDPGTLVPEHRRDGLAELPGGEREIGVADAGRDQPHPHLFRTGIGQDDVAHLERPALLAQHRGLHHDVSLSTERRNGDGNGVGSPPLDHERIAA